MGPAPWPGSGGTAGCAGLGCGRLVVQGVAQDASRQRAGMAPVFEQHLAIDDGVVDPLGEFPNAPAPGREVVHGVLRQRVDGVGVEDRDIGGQARTEQPPIIDTERRGRLEGQPPYGVLQGHDALLAYPVAEQPRAVPIAPMELHMGTAIGEADIGVGVVENLGHRLLIHVRGAFQEDGIQMLLDYEIQEAVDNPLALGLRHFSDRFALLLFIPTVCPSVASRNLLLYQSLPISILYRYAVGRRRKDDTGMGTTSKGIVA